jgi:preprotein translocase subunit SecA
MSRFARPIPRLSLHDHHPRARDARLKGLDAAWHACTGSVIRLARRAAPLLRLADAACEASTRHATASDESIRSALAACRERARRDQLDDQSHVESLGLLREAARRVLGLEPFEVQLAGSLALDAGCAVEMATGEGKTLTAALAATLAGWRGRGVHVVTVNDYLAERDATWMRPLFAWAGLSVESLDEEATPRERRQAYARDITYATAKEVAADWLRDRLAASRASPSRSVRTLAGMLAEGVALPGRSVTADRLVMRGLAHAIVDEADALLIDEAVTPLIIAGDSGEAADERRGAAFRAAATIASTLAEVDDFKVDHAIREVTLTPRGRRKVAAADVQGVPVLAGVRRREELVVQALSARALHEQGRHYLVNEGKIVIVDEFTGRLMSDRTWRDGFHQAVEAKEGVVVTRPKETLDSISFQRFFGMYRRLAGMSGTLSEARRELWSVYSLPVTMIPRHRPSRLRRLPLTAFVRGEDRWRAVVDAIVELNRVGRPVLVGTRSVEASEALSIRLDQVAIPHRVLNALRHREEAQVIAAAGVRGAVTVATNMAGRGTDIRLGTGVEELGGLHVIATELHESERVDRQLAGRAARQGEPGSVQVFVSLEDELFVRFASLEAAAAQRLARDGVVPPMVAKAVARVAQARAQALAKRRRSDVLQSDDQLRDSLGFAAKGR